MADLSIANIGTSLISNLGTAQRPSSPSSAREESNYQFALYVDDPDLDNSKNIFPLIASLPEQFNMSFSSNWREPLAQNSLGDAAQALTGAPVGGLIDTGLQATGTGSKLKSQSIKTWESSSGLAVSLDLVFYAKQNTNKEIKQKHVALLKLAAPSSSGELLKAPGPTVANNLGIVSAGRKITAYIGNYLVLKNIIITGVNSDVIALFDENGIPIGMSIGLQFESFNSCFTTEDIEEAFNGGLSRTG